MEAIETEVKMMEKDVTEIRTLLSSPDTLPSPREESLKVSWVKGVSGTFSPGTESEC